MGNNAVVELARQLLRGKSTFSFNERDYSKEEAIEVLRGALIDANGGSTKIDRKSLRRNKVEIFEIIEHMTDLMLQEGWSGNEFWMNYVDHINTAKGDINEFIAPDNSTFIVTEIADGIATPRRQRIGRRAKVSVDTSIHAIRMYDEYSRFMANRIDWNDLVSRVVKAFDNEIWGDIYTAFNDIDESTTGLTNKYLVKGTYSNEKLVTLIEHVEAATGQSAVILGTKLGLMHCNTVVNGDTNLVSMSEEAKSNLFKQGYFGSFNGTPMVALRQMHKPGTDDFLLDDKTLYVMAGGEKFIKFVEEGETYIDDRDVTRFSDMTLEYFMTKQWGIGILVTGKIGRMVISQE